MFVLLRRHVCFCVYIYENNIASLFWHHCWEAERALLVAVKTEAA